ncbi:MAG: LuxR C-terminal-related transcriptional regulator [Flavipsychrobacter sp.]
MHTPRVRIAIAESQTAFREAMSYTLSQFHNYSIDIEATNGNELIDKIGIATQLPDICIMDVTMPIRNAYSVVPTIKQKWPTIKIFILSNCDSDYAIKNLLLHGANAYLSKSATMNEILIALNSLKEFGFHYSDKTPQELFNKVTNGKITVPEITEREKEILQLLCKNYTYKEIGEKLFISPRTVDAHRDKLFNKLSIKSKEGLILFAIKSGLVFL